MIIAWNYFAILGTRLKIGMYQDVLQIFVTSKRWQWRFEEGGFKMRIVLDHLKVVSMKNFANAMNLMMPSEYKRDALACFGRG